MTGVASSTCFQPTGGEAGGEMRNCLSGLGGARCELPMCNVCGERALISALREKSSGEQFTEVPGRLWEASTASSTPTAREGPGRGQGGHQLLFQEL